MLLRKTPNIIPKRFIGPLDHVVEFEVCAGPLEGALKIGDKVVKELAQEPIVPLLMVAIDQFQPSI